MKSGPHLPQLEKALAQKRRPNTAIKREREREREREGEREREREREKEREKERKKESKQAGGREPGCDLGRLLLPPVSVSSAVERG